MKNRSSAPKTVAEYLARVPAPARAKAKQLRTIIRSALPRGVTEVISYRMPAFKGDGVIVWYGGFRDHCSLFPGGRVLGTMKDEVAGFKTSKGTIQFPLGRQLPASLIKRIVKARLREMV